jgi:transcriptional regulator with XRE-family HTH domain
MVSGQKKQPESAPKNVGGRPRSVQLSSLGERIENLAKIKGLTRQELSEQSGVSANALWSVLAGKTRPRLDTAIKIADALGVPVSSLVG